MDWSIRKGSRIDRLPRAIQPVALLLRNALSGRRRRKVIDDYHHRADGIATKHIDRFRDEAGFRRAYARAIKASGWDYQIPYRIHQALWCSRLAQKVQGDLVELGTGRGFVMSAVLADWPEWASCNRSVYLFDTFKSAPVDEQGRQSAACKALPYYATSVEDVRKNFSEWPRVHIHVGDVRETLAYLEVPSVAMLHIDMNHHEPETYGLRALWSRIPRWGVVLLDDYAYRGHDRQYDEMNELAAELGTCILSTPTGQGIIVK